MVDQMRPSDRVAIVTYAGSAGVALASTPGHPKTRIKAAIKRLGAGGRDIHFKKGLALAKK